MELVRGHSERDADTRTPQSCPERVLQAQGGHSRAAQPP